MKDGNKTKEQLASELVELHQRIAQLETPASEYKRVEVLYALAQVTGQTVGVEEMLNDALAKVVQATGADVGLIYLLDVAEKALLLKAHLGITKRDIGRTSTVRLNDEEFQGALDWNELRISSSGASAEPLVSFIAEVVAKTRAKSFAAVSFSGEDDLRGLLIVASHAYRQFDPDEIELLGILGKHVGFSLGNAARFEELNRMATIDRLTGLHNHGYFQERLAQEVIRCSRYSQECSLIMLDLDHFRVYNDLVGHVAGDEVLEKVGGVLCGCTRQEDIACRCTGAGFAIILPQTGASAAYGVAERLRQAVAAVLLEESAASDANLTLSLGVASFPSDGPSLEGLIRRADVALAAAKQRGRNQTCMASDVLRETADTKRTFWEVAEYLETASSNSIYAMAAAVDARDYCTYMHSRNVSRYSVAIGKAIGLSKKKVEGLRIAALLHDVGKIGVSDSVIRKPGPLDEQEWEVMKKHPELGATIIDHIPELADCAPAIRHHHEWFDGSGYPDRLKGKDIPVEARVIAIAEAYDNMTTPRSYRHIVSHEQALEELRQHSSTQFDPTLVLAFISAIG